ncbi:MAG: hypothetical protein IT542_01820 [Rubellimicrobium sp.]|nr:hypothetical protein [Rubellimicrobium sp.]
MRSALSFLRALPDSAAFGRGALFQGQTRPGTGPRPTPTVGRFEDVTLWPSTGFLCHGQIADGGPSLPPGSDPLIAGYRRNDIVFALPDRQGRGQGRRGGVLRGPHVWGGYAARHFGHLIAEHLPRLVAGLDAAPDATCLLALRPEGITRIAPWLSVPGMVTDALAWFGVPRHPDATAHGDVS